MQELRETRHLTQRETAKLLDITKNPSDELKEILKKLYNVFISDIFLSLKETKRFKN